MKPTGKHRIIEIIRGFWQGMLDLAFPPYCLRCNGRLATGEVAVCGHCLSKLQPFIENAPDPETIWLETIKSAFLFDDLAQFIIHRLKYSGNYGLGFNLGILAARQCPEFFTAFGNEAILVPVPLHLVKFRTRGYNQAEAVAQGIAMENGLTVCTDIIRRARVTKTQTKLNKSERRENVKDAFSLRKKIIPDCPIILIDDVFTTGATMDSAAAALAKKGARQINGFTVARPILDTGTVLA